MSANQQNQSEFDDERVAKAERALNEAALQSLREYRKARYAARQLPCQPKAA